MTTSRPIFGIMSPGDMGHRVGEALRARGIAVVTALDGRSATTRMRAKRAGFEDVGSIDRLVASCDVLLSIMPPAEAERFAESCAAAIAKANRDLLFVDCNAIAPATMQRIASRIAAAGAHAMDVGIIGPPPGGSFVTRFYASGPYLGGLSLLDGGGMRVIGMGAEIGRASAIKMCYAALTKGTTTLRAAVLLAGEQLGVADDLKGAIAETQRPHWEGMNQSLPFVAADAVRWAGEMDEIAATFAAAGVTSKMHEGAADIFRLLAASPLSSETREAMDKSRTLDQALAAFVDTLRKRR